MPYEADMSVSYDEIAKSVTVLFRGKKIVLRGPYQTREEGKRAGENFCRQNGWSG